MVSSAPMSRWLILGVLVACTSVQAAPASGDDDVQRFLHDRGLLERLDQVRTDVAQRASGVAHRASELVVSAMGFLGLPYRRGGNSAETGFDCSGFVKAIYEQTVGMILPRRADQQASVGQKVEQSELQPGDLVFFNTMRRTFSHVGIYVGDNKFIHSPKPGAQVRVEDMTVGYWAKRYDGARRLLERDAAGQVQPQR